MTDTSPLACGGCGQACNRTEVYAVVSDAVQAEAELLGAGRIGMSLTESHAMLPAASVSGFYLSHSAARYFAVGQIAEDQKQDYANRKAAESPTSERRREPVRAYGR